MSTVLVMNNDNSPADVIGGGVAVGIKLERDHFNVDTGRLVVLAESEKPEKPTVIIAFPESEVAVAKLLVEQFPTSFTDRTEDLKTSLAGLVPATGGTGEGGGT